MPDRALSLQPGPGATSIDPQRDWYNIGTGNDSNYSSAAYDTLLRKQQQLEADMQKKSEMLRRMEMSLQQQLEKAPE